eukprot:GCRY01002285.1.p1 GENE.GCRY01002285.1~~GCRY01002285.1.p1  ORF type:complete len:300 (-),score=58.32 GCRY01002285.1:176-1075(-)
MKLTVLGTSSGAPTKERNVSSYALTFDHGEIWLFDCGEGVQYQLMKDECTLKTSKVSSIFITHLHGDHVFGLFGLLATISLRGRESPVRIIGPVGIQELLTTVASLTYTFFNFDISYHELEPEKCHSLKFGDIVVDVCPLAHRVPSFGYVLREPDRVGKFNAQMANEFGLKGKDIGILRTAGKLEWNGTVLEASAFYGPSRPGRRAALLGDTCDCSALYTLPCINDGYGLSLLLHEATFDSTEQARAAENGHSTAYVVSGGGCPCGPAGDGWKWLKMAKHGQKLGGVQSPHFPWPCGLL